MATLAEVFVSVRAETSKFSDDLRKKLSKVQAEREARGLGERTGKGFNDGFGSSLKRTAGLIGGAFAAVGAVNLFKGFITEAAESAKIARITENAIRATGGAARITADEVGKLATQLSNKTAVDDELIQSGANLILTFKNIKNEAGAGNDVFNQATAAALDLSAAGFGSVESASKQLGKALNDPIKGTTALAKAGVTFTEQQKDQIKTLVESGRVLDAQKIILGEVQSQVGGAAAAAADPMARLTVIAGNLGEEIGGVLLPYVERFATFLADRVIPTVSDFLAEMESGTGAGGRFAEIMRGAGDVIETVIDVVKGGVGFVRDHADAFLALAAGVTAGVVAFKAITLAMAIAGLIGTVVTAIRSMTVAQLALNVAMLANPIGLVAVAIGALVAAFVVAYRKSEMFRDIVNGAFHAVKMTVESIIYDDIIPAIKALLNTVFSAGESIAKAGETIARALGQDELAGKLRVAAAVMKVFKNQANEALNGIVDKRVTIDVVANQAMGSLPEFKAENRRGRATGGPVFGPGTGTSDSIPAMLSNNEHVWTAREVRAAGGHGMVEALRRSVVRGFAGGGAVVPGTRVPSDADIDLIRVRGQKHVDSIAERIAKALNLADALGDAIGAGGFRWQMAVLRKVFPGLALISGFRPGAITATGNASYHGKGRAVDLPPRMDVFNWIRSMFGATTKELIFTPAGGRQIHNGRPHVFTGVTARNHVGHIHWAYDEGGVARGAGFLPKTTIKPERMLSPRQTSTYDKSLPVLERLVQLMESGRGPGGGLAVAGDVYAYDPREVVRELERRQHQRDALSAAW